METLVRVERGLKHPFDDARNVSAEMTADKGTENRSSCGHIRERKFHIVNQTVVHLIDRPSTGAKRFLNIPASKNGRRRGRTRLVIKKGWPAGAKKLFLPFSSSFSQGDATTPVRIFRTRLNRCLRATISELTREFISKGGRGDLLSISSKDELFDEI